MRKKEHQNSGTLGKDTINKSKEIIANIKPNRRNGEQPDVYFDEELYKNRFKIEQANGWLDGYKGSFSLLKWLKLLYPQPTRFPCNKHTNKQH